MASDYRIISPATTLYLVNSSGTPTAGGAATAANTTPWAIRSDWVLAAPEPDTVYGGGAPLVSGASLRQLTYPNVTETVTLAYLGTSADGAADAMTLLSNQFATLASAPAALYAKPNGATNATYYAIYSAQVQPRAWPSTERSPGEGAYKELLVDLTITRSYAGGAASLATLINAVTFGNTGTGSPNNVTTLGALTGDLQGEGQPLNIQMATPSAGTASYVYLASVYSRTYQAIASSVTTSSTTGANFTASTAIDVSALRTRAGLRLRTMARLTTLTAPSKAEVRVTVQTTAGNTLWVGAWVGLDTNTTAQIVDLRCTSLDAERYPISNTANVLLQCAIRSTDGTSVTATLGYIEALLYYDFCTLEASGGLGASQRYQLLGAQNFVGGWLPSVPPLAVVTDTSDVLVKPAVYKGTPPLARTGASLYVAWASAGHAHTTTETAAITVTHAPLWRAGLRGTT